MSEHSLLPWECDSRWGQVVAVDGELVAQVSTPLNSGPTAQANAEFIVRACNADADLLAACEAALAYDKAIRECANDPDKMASYCTAQGDTLDSLYADWINKAEAAIAKEKP